MKTYYVANVTQDPSGEVKVENRELVVNDYPGTGRRILSKAKGLTIYDLRYIFGKENAHTTPGDAVDAEWIVETPYGIVIVYNWKNGFNYTLNKEIVTEWNIGAKSLEAQIIVEDMIDQYLAEMAKEAEFEKEQDYAHDARDMVVSIEDLQ